MAGDLDRSLQSLRAGPDFVLYRGTDSDELPILALAVRAEHPSPRNLRRLEHEYSLASELDATWAVQPLALSQHQGRAVLILRDPGGDLLDQTIERRKGQPADLTRFLRIAIGLAAALSGAHRQGLIHKDINPASAFVDDSGHAWLTGFGIASRLRRESCKTAPAETSAGTLAYMSPEQTGRMNRSIDARSDLYSLGVTLYQMLTGALTFVATDPLEWVHCHIARQPVPPASRADIPGPLSAIIMKLLGKNAEDRYQTASGLKADLCRCLSQWQSRGHIEPFRLGTEDSSDRMLIPEKLYGREREVASLLTAFDRVVAQGTTQLVLISGYSGIGKSSVVNELQKVMLPARGLFALGKYDQYKRDVPYATLAQAFKTLVRQILTRSEFEIARWRHALLAALGPNGQLIINLIPEVEWVVGKQAPVSELPSQESHERFQSVFRRFLGTFAQEDHPLALFLDDLQWIDTASLGLLTHLITDQNVRHVLMIGAYRDNEVDASHPLIRTLAGLRDAGVQPQEIVLAPLRQIDIAELIAETLHRTPSSVSSLARVIHEKTGGNPLFAVQFLTSLPEQGLLRFDRNTANWSWDVDRIRAMDYADNVLNLMIEKLSGLPDRTRVALQQLSCLGNAVDMQTLVIALGLAEEQLHPALWPALREELIERLPAGYRFVHDRVQEAAYLLIPTEGRPVIHLQIGRRLIARTPAKMLSEAAFEIVNQLNRVHALITVSEEREQVAELNLLAGRRARSSTAYTAALVYLSAGSALLADEGSVRRPDLAFALELERAGCEFLIGKLAAADVRLTALADHTANIVEAAALACLHMDVCMTLDQIGRAVGVALECLRKVGIDRNARPTDEETQREYARVWSLLRGREIEELIDLPVVCDPELVATLDVLERGLTPALFADANLLSVLVCTLVNLSLERGHCGASCTGYIWLGMIAGAKFGDYEAGFRFGRLGYNLAKERELKQFKALTYLSFGVYIVPWSKHVRAARDFIRRAFDAAMSIGDLTTATSCGVDLFGNLFMAGDTLDNVHREAELSLGFARKTGSGLWTDIGVTQLALIRTLRGLTTTFGCFNDTQFDETTIERRLSNEAGRSIAACWYWIRKLQARYFAGDYATAVEASLHAQRLLWSSPSFLETSEAHFYGALSHAASCDPAFPHQHAQHLAALTAHHRQLVAWAENCPENFANRASLVAAEIARIEGRHLDSMHLYEQAIRSAHDNGFVHNEALAYEVAARFYDSRGFDKIAESYLHEARSCYVRWGADGKVKQLDSCDPSGLEDRTPGSLPGNGTLAIELDTESVVKASQALSSEMVLSTLVEKLVRIAVENAGAQRGLLVMLKNGEERIEAEANTRSGMIEATGRRTVASSSDLLQAALRAMIFSERRVLIDDASADKIYSRDDYVRKNLCRSVLCLPIFKQAKIIGALYLENNLTAGAFTPERVTVLQLLASQAAISLENAALYTDLQLQVGLLQHLPVSAWTLEPDGTPDFVNRVWLEFSGQALNFVRSQPEAWMSAVHPDDREQAARHFWEGVHSGKEFAMETRNFHAEDGTYRWHLSQAVPLRDTDGKLLKFVGTTTDIDDQRKTEKALRQAQSDLARINRVTTMGELAASLAHELSQPIAGAMTNADVCLLKLARDAPDLVGVHSAVTRIARDVGRANEIIGRIRSQFTRGVSSQDDIDLNEITRGTVALLRDEAARYNISIRMELADRLPPIIGDRVQLQQVAMNLIVNSIEAIRYTDRAREIVIRSEQAEAGVLISISDTGAGFSPDLAEQIFEPFFTTKPQGTGMGLRISRSIIEAHHGRLWAAGNPGSGATFHMILPVADK
jgi:PAS domain S-box-containing protein